jgi:hypothetical protein
MTTGKSASLPVGIHERLVDWSARWAVPGLATSVVVTFSRQLVSTLARCQPAEGRIVLRADITGDPERLTEVLCHELAHVAVHRLYGPEAKPHGPEWQALVRAAGFSPKRLLRKRCRLELRLPGSTSTVAQSARACVWHAGPLRPGVVQSVLMLDSTEHS